MAVYLDLGDATAARAVVAGMPPSARAVGLLAMHGGDWRRAGLSAYDEEGWTSDSDYCEIWQAEALRDYALKTGELNRAIAFIKSKYYFADAPAEQPDVDIGLVRNPRGQVREILPGRPPGQGEHRPFAGTAP